MAISRGMVDWVTGLLPCHHAPLRSGAIIKIGPAGDVEWQTSCRVDVRGSHDARISVRSLGGDGQGNATHLLLDGNPSKFLQGHNIFGSDDLLSLVYDTFARIIEVLDLNPSCEELSQVKAGNYRLSRIDYNQSFELPTRSDVNSWIRAAEMKAKTRHGRPLRKSGTLYFGKSSRRWSFKAYSKGEEIAVKSHRLPDILQIPDLISWADNKLRLELTLRTLELKELGLCEARMIDSAKLASVYNRYLRSIDMSDQISLSTEKQLKLPRRLRSTYTLWQIGEDLRDTLPHATYYRHRKELLEHGIDIALRREVADRSNVVPLIRILEAKPADIPAWAFECGLVHDSAWRSASC